MFFGYFKIAKFNKKACFLLGFFILCGIMNSQNQKISDSLENIYKRGNYESQDKLKIIKQLAVNETDTEKKLAYSLLLIQTAKELDSVDYLFQGFLEKGNALRLKSDHSHALESYFQGAKIATEEKQKSRLGSIYIAIADVYSIMGNHKNSVTYYKGAITILKKEKDYINVGSAQLNLGDEYINSGELQLALTQPGEEPDFETLQPVADEVVFGPSEGRINTLNFRFDTWVLPFLQVAGFYGKVYGKQTITLTLCVGLLSLSDEQPQDWAFGLSMN